MSTIFVNKSGANGNSGATRALAKLTIQAAHDAAVSNVDTVKIGSGEYREAVAITKALTWEADVDSPNRPSGFVVIDGENVRASGMTLTPVVDGIFRGLTFRRHTVTDVDHVNSISGTYERCAFIDGARGVQMQNGGAFVISRCLFRNKTAAGIRDANSSAAITASHNLFDSCLAGIQYQINAPAATSIFNNVFRACTRDLDLGALTAAQISAWLIDFNSHFGWVTAVGRLASTDYATLAAWRTASTKEANSLDSDPLLLDVAKSLFLSRTDSPLRRRGRSGETIGLGTGEGISNNRNPLLWTGGILTLASIVGGNVVQTTSGVNATYQTDVLDMGALAVVSGFPISALVSYAAQVIDHSIADSAPNRPTIEYRTSASAFIKTDPAPAYVAIERDSVFTTPVTGRFWQFRAVLRSDGVAA